MVTAQRVRTCSSARGFWLDGFRVNLLDFYALWPKRKRATFLCWTEHPIEIKAGISAKITKLKSTIPVAFGQKPRGKMVSWNGDGEIHAARVR